MTARSLAAEILDLPDGPDAFGDESFISLGGDSLRALRLAAVLQEELGLRVPLMELLGDAPLAQVLDAATPVTAPGPEARADDRNGPAEQSLTPAQRGMWLIERVAGGSPYNLVFRCFTDGGRLDRDVLAKAVAATVARHEGLRTVFRESDDDVVQEILPAYVPELVEHTYVGPAEAFESEVRRQGADLGREPFDLAAAPAYRFGHWAPADVSDERSALVLAAHHMVLDGHAVGQLLREILETYTELTAAADQAVPRDLGTPLAALRRHQEEARARGAWDEQTALWRERLDGVPSVLELPADRQRPAVQDGAGDRLGLDLGPAVTERVAARARALGITPYAFLLGAFGLTLARRTGVRSLLVGVPLLGRGSSELSRLIAVAGNLVPVRVDVDDDLDVAAFLRGVHRSLAAAIDAGDLPFEELVARLGVERSLGCHPLVQVCFGMHDQLVPRELTAGPLRVRIEEGHGGGSQFDLTMLIGHADPSYAGHLEYATSVWHQAEAEGFVADFRAAVGQLADAPDARLEDVRGISAEGRALLDEINASGRDFPVTSLDALFREVAARTPDAVAVRDAEQTLTYGRLAEAAAEQARLLLAAGVRPGDRVLVGVERSVAEAVAVLGVARAGAAYVGIDPTLPDSHVTKILERARPTAALTGPVAGPVAERFAGLGVPAVATWEPDWRPGPADAVATPPADPARLAYVAFTSGSTGQPKGVCVPHRAVIRLVHEAGYVRLGAGERMLRLSPLSFDASTLELWGALLTGAVLEVHPAGLASPTELGAFLQERGITVAWLTAGLFRLVEEFAPESLGGLRQLLTGGDVVPHEHTARLLARHPGIVVTNGYGPTENTTFTTTHSVARAEDVDGPLPIGRPVPGTRVHVLDARRRLLPPGAVGELYTGGDGLADGYLGDEAETARVFGHLSPDVPERLYRTGDLVRVDTSGRLRFLGRADDQVKLRGYRIELSAISDVLTEHPEVQDAVVVVTDGGGADKRLVAAVVLAPDAAVDAVALRDLLTETLPSYMVPTLWAVVDRLPVTANGKVDRRALVAVAKPARRSAGTPVAAVEEPVAAPAPPAVDLERIAGLFAAVIEGEPVTDVTEDTDFFVIGGNSLGAVRLMRKVKQELGATVRLRDFLLSPTPAGLSALVEKAAER
ncbi:non-ribosomal peptide synthetase [Streptomyces vietnamensis]|uniref:Amino acid adenylation protein n=1 Tax=Streptomyces vietnamensis TaxID=362257 RepID=A0A0B5I5E5_9ACTN|nr:non-ribosomal peptide synthetase [Streptomyces vietnamensis]AJF67781.1 amino acid adenylation protein [Streptomyces vietnamensis]